MMGFSTRGARSEAQPYKILVGPGPRLEGMAQLLAALASRHGALARAEAAEIADLAELLTGAPEAGHLVLDVDHLPAEDIGFLRRFLARHPGWELVLVGQDAGRQTARSVLALPRTRWLAWPPDLDQLHELARGPVGSVGGEMAAGPPTQEPPRQEPPPQEPSSAAEPPVEIPRPPVRLPRAARAPAEELPPVRPALPERAIEPPPRARAESAPAIPHLREQIAVLADIAQRLELSFGALRETKRAPEGELEGMALELRRLLRFTRALSHLASPQGEGGERFELGALVEEELAALTLKARRAPRLSWRGSGKLWVRADRVAFTMALESLLVLARACAGVGETVRVEAGAGLSDDLWIRIDFPAGPLAGIDPEKVLDPVVLAERLREIGVEEIGAAIAILRAQGAELSAYASPGEHLLLQIRMPLAPPPAEARAESRSVEA
jgi:hypothetical protein